MALLLAEIVKVSAAVGWRVKFDGNRAYGRTELEVLVRALEPQVWVRLVAHVGFWELPYALEGGYPRGRAGGFPVYGRGLFKRHLGGAGPDGGRLAYSLRRSASEAGGVVVRVLGDVLVGVGSTVGGAAQYVLD